MGVNIHDIVEKTPVQDWTVPLVIAVAGEIDHGKSTIAKMIAAKFGHREIAFADHLRHVCQVMFDIYPHNLTDRELKHIPLVGLRAGYKWPFDPFDPRALDKHIDVMLGAAYFVDSDTFTDASTRPISKDSVRVGGNQLSPADVRRGIVTQFNRHIWLPLCNGRVFTPREIMQLLGTEVFRAVDPPMWIWAWGQQVGDPAANVVAPDLRFPNEVAAVEALGGVCIKVVRPGHRGTQRMDHSSESMLSKHKFDFVLVNDATVEELWRVLQQVMHIYAKTNTDAVDNGYAKLITA